MIYLIQILKLKLWQFSTSIFLTIISSFLEIIVLLTIAPIISKALNAPASSENLNIVAKEVLGVWVSISGSEDQFYIFYVVVVLLSVFMKIATLYINNKTVLELGEKLGSSLFSGFLRLGPFADDKISSHALNSTAQKIQTISTSIMVPVVNAFSSSVIALSIISVIFFQENLKVLLGVSLIILLYVLLVIIVRKRLERNSKVIDSYQNKRAKYITESVSGYKDLVFGGLIDTYRNNYKANEALYKNSALWNLVTGAYPKFAIEGLIIIGIVISIGVLSSDGSDNSILLTSLVTTFVALLRLVPHIQQIYNAWSRVSGGKDMISSIYEEISFKYANYADKSCNGINSIKGDVESICLNVDYRNNAFCLKTEGNILIQKGDIVFLKGDSGSGKTTFLNIISGLIPSEAGLSTKYNFLSDVNNLNTFDVAYADPCHNGLISFVTQDGHIFQDSIMFNICLTNDLNKIDVHHLKTVIRVCGVDTIIGDEHRGIASSTLEGGRGLSGGQKQRLLIARALYQGRSVMFLDEATSALDSGSEGKIIEQIAREEYGIIFIVSHNHSLEKYANKVLFFENKDGCTSVKLMN